MESETWTCVASSKDSGTTGTDLFNTVFRGKMVGLSFIAVLTLTDNFTHCSTVVRRLTLFSGCLSLPHNQKRYYPVSALNSMH